MLNRCLLCSGLVLLGVFAARADDPPKNAPRVPPAIAELLKSSPEDFIKRFDRNRDGFLIPLEMPRAMIRMFPKADLNGDGKLDKEEVDQMLQGLRRRYGLEKDDGPAPDRAEIERTVKEWLEKLDANKDGKISKAEAKAGLAENFDKIDTNKDGYLDKNELRKVAQRWMKLKGKAEKANKGKDREPQPVGPDFDSLDKDADGRLSREELKDTPFANKFDEMDTDKDGSIDRKEYAAFLKKQAKK
jgi:Ca2+-binding EF-hand superfamily protein